MKKIIIFSVLLISSTILSSCSPIVQGAAAVTTVATMSNDRRTMGEIIDDKTLYINLGNIVSKDSALDGSHINFNIYNKSILMTGEVSSDELKDYLDELVKMQVPNPGKLINEVVVMPNSSYLSRAKDAVISVQIEALFIDQEVFHPTHISVRTEAGAVYLMGSVTKREAEHATNIASRAKNVKKVVKLFNYLLERPAEEIERDNKKREDAEKKAALESKQAELEAAQNDLQVQINELNSN
tara:strand:- start:350 stop:1072 length:723 start_codon:yes stop_codon:yes gene_type:complete